MEHMRFEPAHGTKTSLVLGSLIDFRLSNKSPASALTPEAKESKLLEIVALTPS